MKTKINSLLLLSQLTLLGYGVNNIITFDEATLELSPNVSPRPKWIKGEKNEFPYVKEIQIHLGKGDEKILIENSRDKTTAITPHFTVLSNGEVIQHAYLEQIAHSFPKINKRQILQDQYLIHVNVAGEAPNLKQIKTLHKLIDLMKKELPTVSIKWCVPDPSFLTIPWLSDLAVCQYSDSLPLYKLFTLTHYSSEISSVADKPLYWVGSMNYFSRNEGVPNVINIFRTGKSREKTFESYLNKNKKLSSHFTIDEDSRIFQHVSLGQASYFVTPCYGPQILGQQQSRNQITIGLTGSLEEPITPAQQERIKELVKLIRSKYDIKSWTTPVPTTKDSTELEGSLIPGLEKLKEVHLTKDPQINTAASLIYDYPSQNHEPRPEGAVVDTIVLHHTFGSWPTTLIQHTITKESGNISYHFTISQEGTIVQHIPFSMKAWHAGISKDKRGKEGVNGFSIGITLENAGDCKDPYPKPQTDALYGLIKDLRKAMGENFVQITTHQYVAPNRHNNPLGFPWEALEEFEEYIVRNTDDEILEKEYQN